jgi:type I restriction enzyme S subunit
MTTTVAKLGEVVEIKGGGTPSKANPAFWNGDIPWVSPKDMKCWEIADAEDKITMAAIKGSATNLIPKNSILVVNRSGILKHTLPVGITRRPVAINQDIKALVCNERSHPDYIAHIVKAAEPIILKWVRATTADNFPIDNLREFEIPLPPLDEQRRIAAILDKADVLRRKGKHALDLVESLTHSIFLEMFGDPVTNPKKLTKIALGNLIKVKSGNGLVAKDMAPNGSFAVYGGNGINGYHDEFMFEHPKLVIGRVGVYCGAVHLTKPKSWVTDNALYVSEFKKPVSVLYLQSALIEANLNQYAGRAAQPLISGSRIYPIEIMLPSNEEQIRFETAIMRLSRLDEPFRAVGRSMNILFASLQHRAFSGELG